MPVQTAEVPPVKVMPPIVRVVLSMHPEEAHVKVTVSPAVISSLSALKEVILLGAEQVLHRNS